MPPAADPATVPAAPSLARVRRGDLCAGCGLCAALAPGAVEMRMEPPGFLRPHQTAPVPPEADRAIAAACPGLVHEVRVEGRPDHPLWGPYLAMRTGHAADPALRHRASSGGALSAALVHLLETGAVEGVLQVAADPDDPVGNVAVLSRTPAEIMAAAGSRYAPSAPLAGLEPLLAAGRPLAFAGKPCDAAALRALMRTDPRARDVFPYVLSFFCAGVPARAGAVEVLAALGAPESETRAFRYRGMGWPGRATATLEGGAERSMTYHESWGRILSRHVQHRCKICADGTGCDADLVCADAWESDDKGYPLFEEGEGTSLIVARTERGLALLREAEAAGRLATAPFDVARLAAIQPGQRSRRTALAPRLAALRLLGRPVPHYRGLGVLRAARLGERRWQARNFLGMARRVLRPARPAAPSGERT